MVINTKREREMWRRLIDSYNKISDVVWNIRVLHLCDLISLVLQMVGGEEEIRMYLSWHVRVDVFFNFASSNDCYYGFLVEGRDFYLCRSVDRWRRVKVRDKMINSRVRDIAITIERGCETKMSI